MKVNTKKTKETAIVILNWRDIHHPLAGGAEISLHEQARQWISMGAKVLWYSSSWKGARKSEVIDSIKIVRYGNQYSIHLIFFINHFFNKIPKYDKIIDCFHFVPFFTPLFIQKKKIVALINEVAGDLWDANIFFPLSFIGKKLEPFFFKLYSGIEFITASESASIELQKLGVDKKRINIIQHGVTTPGRVLSFPKEKNPTILFLNRISPDKGIEDALKAYKIISQKFPNTHLWVAGKEERKNIMQDLLDKYQLKKNITYFGYISQDQKFELMRKAWVLIHPSKKEGWGLTVIEAAGQGTPTIGYDVPGLRDSIKKNKTGLLCAPDYASLANSVDSFMDNSEPFKKFEKECIAWSESFSWQKAGEKSWNALESHI